MQVSVDLIVPHTNDFGSAPGSYALNASAALYETLEYILDKNSQHIYNIGTYYTDNSDFKIQEERTLAEIEIELNPVTQTAWNFGLEQSNEK